MTAEPLCWGGEGFVSHPLHLTTGLVVNSFIITNPTLAGERMRLIPKVSILSEQKYLISSDMRYLFDPLDPTGHFYVHK